MACTAACVLSLAACGGGGSDSTPSDGSRSGATPTPTPPVSTTGPTTIQTQAQASQFLNYATFGATSSGIQSMVGQRTSGWVAQQLALSPTLILNEYVQREASGEEFSSDHFSKEYWRTMITANDQLRQRMAFALSQILVVDDDSRTLRTAYYFDILSRNAFGNYRDILQEVTYSPKMGDYLTYIRNRGDREDQGRMPDENYAREILQLFSIGLVELNMDGSTKLDGVGQATETYTNEDVVGLSRVFTGLSTNGETFWRADDDGLYSPMIMWERYHSPHEKSFLGLSIPAGTPGDESVTQALDHIFEHPNLAPFISRQLIQRFTASHPSPEYVETVATAFETGRFSSRDGRNFGTGERGDLAATIAAILLDESLMMDEENLVSSQGKIREPVLRFTQLVRAFDTENIYPLNERRLRDTTSPSTRLGQQAFRSPSVFNFYRPGYIAPSTQTGAANLTAPEFQIVNASSVVGYNNFMADFIQDRSSQSDSSLESFKPNYTTEIALADDPAALVDHLDTLLTGGRMMQETHDNITSAIANLPISDTSETEDRLKRVELAVIMTVSSPSYFIQR